MPRLHRMMFNISPEYFRAAGTALLSGRSFTWHDDKNAPRVAVINQEFARKIFGSAANALGDITRCGMARASRWSASPRTENTSTLTEDPSPRCFFPSCNRHRVRLSLVVRSNRDPQQLAAAIRSKLRDLDAGLPCFIQTWNEEMNLVLFPSRVATVALGVLGMMGAMLSITGIFGMAAYSVSKRLRELGIRMALGAQKRQVLQAALGRAFKLLAFGSACGLLLGILGSRVLSYIVYQATPRDPLVLACVVLAMSLLGLLATWIPAQRALSVEPLMLLREE